MDAASLAPLPDELAAWWVRWRGYLADRALQEAASKAKGEGPPGLAAKPALRPPD
ncbi:MAG TPA: hypothetical protein VFS43_15125 [Polyangiaceae bacterium]|nr:hypothetical protein [Polyangiaceae bacterium]